MAASLIFPCVAMSVSSVVTLLMVRFCFRFFTTGNNAAVLGRVLRSHRSQSCLMELEAQFLGSKSQTIHGIAWGIHQLWSHPALPSPSLCPMPLLHRNSTLQLLGTYSWCCGYRISTPRLLQRQHKWEKPHMLHLIGRA